MFQNALQKRAFKDHRQLTVFDVILRLVVSVVAEARPLCFQRFCFHFGLKRSMENAQFRNGQNDASESLQVCD